MTANDTSIPDDIAEAVLIAAMVMDAELAYEYHGWHSFNRQQGDVRRTFASADHGGTLGACYAAWCWAKGVDISP